MNYDVYSTADGKEAEALFQQFSDKISMVLTDVVMPEIGGLICCRC
jgi:CheY-like chemotaxis protein